MEDEYFSKMGFNADLASSSRAQDSSSPPAFLFQYLDSLDKIKCYRDVLSNERILKF